MSYRLESPRQRSPPPPLRIRSSGYVRSSLGSPTTLLYDLPQPSSRSPPPQSADSSQHLPFSPPPPGSPTNARQRTRQTSPCSRSTTPAQIARQELDQFAALCHAWYFDQDERAGQLMTQIIESLRASQRAPFSRLQASIRSSYHTAVTKRRKSEFRAHLSSTHPGGSLSPSSRANTFGKAAKKERLLRFNRFLKTWCTAGMPGTRPFFHGLWAVLRLQVLPITLGGAGSKRIEWEFDDAVFQESAGKEFMLEAIDVLKGVLGFEEYLPPRSRRHSRASSDDVHRAPASTPVSSQSLTTRPRSPSDPFLDTPAISRTLPTATSRTPTIRSSTLLPRPRINEESEPSSQSNLPEPSPQPLPSSHAMDTPDKEPLDADDDSLDGEPYMRRWTSTDLDNPELQSLISLFPAFITRQTLPRFPLARSTVPDLEVGQSIAGEGKDVSCGTGRMYVGERQRRDGWKGGWWHRFTGWWRRLFN